MAAFLTNKRWRPKKKKRNSFLDFAGATYRSCVTMAPPLSCSDMETKSTITSVFLSFARIPPAKTSFILFPDHDEGSLCSLSAKFLYIIGSCHHLARCNTSITGGRWQKGRMMWPQTNNKNFRFL